MYGTLYGAVDFFNVLKKGCFVGGGGGVVEVHKEIHFVPLGVCWEEVVVHNVLHYVPLHPLRLALRCCHRCNGQISTVSSVC
jgi:hypothetical protein